MSIEFQQFIVCFWCGVSIVIFFSCVLKIVLLHGAADFTETCRCASLAHSNYIFCFDMCFNELLWLPFTFIMKFIYHAPSNLCIDLCFLTGTNARLGRFCWNKTAIAHSKTKSSHELDWLCSCSSFKLKVCVASSMVEISTLFCWRLWGLLHYMFFWC